MFKSIYDDNKMFWERLIFLVSLYLRFRGRFYKLYLCGKYLVSKIREEKLEGLDV